MPLYSDNACALDVYQFTVNKVAKTDATPHACICENDSVKYVTSVTGDTVNPIVITCAGHGLSTGDQIAVEDVVGNKAANGFWTVTVLSSSTFSIPATGDGDWIDTTAKTVKPRFYVSVPGLHDMTLTYDPALKMYTASIDRDINLIVGNDYFIAVTDPVYKYHATGVETCLDRTFGSFGL